MTKKTKCFSVARDHFDAAALIDTCHRMAEDFQQEYDMTRVETEGKPGDDFYLFKDNGSRVLAVAHLDTVQQDRTTTVTPTMVRSGALDDRLGAYVIAELLPKMGVTYDLLFTTGEESGASTAEHFDPARHHEREYDWIIEFDRGGTDVVLYQYEDEDLIDRVAAAGVVVEAGAFSDISFLEHLGIKALNWGVGYRDYHSMNGHAYLSDVFKMVDAFMRFHAVNYGVRLPHIQRETPWWRSYRGSGDEYVPDECEENGFGDDCHGPVKTTEYGVLCQYHAGWYVD